MTIVVDASVAVSWCFPDEDDVYATRVRDLLKEVDAVAPAIWAVEIANAMVNGHRRARIDDADLVRAVEVLGDLPIAEAPISVAEAIGAVARIAIGSGLSSYDASYVYLAMREGVPLATLDAKLRAAAEAVGCEVLGDASW